MKIKKFVEKNKQKIVKWLGVILIGIGIIGLVSSLVPKFNSSPKSNNKKHFLCIGVDKYEPMGEREPVYNSIGQADGIFLITHDVDNSKIDIVAVPRDTIVTIQKYYSNMEYIGKEEAQICLQYAYADGKEKSCEFTVDRVEELFDGIKIDGYVAINMISVLEINEAIGGVTVIVENKDTAKKMGIEVGSSVHLTEDNISLYLQSRDKSEAKSAYGRMDRLKDYVKAFIPRALEVVKENPVVVTDVMAVLDEHMITDLSAIDIAQLVTDVSKVSVENITYQILEGNVILGSDGYEEFYPNKYKLKRIVDSIK